MSDLSVDYLRIWVDEPLPDLSFYRPFKAVVILAEQPSPEWQDQVSRWLVDNGCLYMMAWGANSSTWDDSVDWANLEDWDFGDIPDENFVMTTWHDDEPLRETLGFARVAAWHGDVDLRYCLLVDVSRRNRRDELIAMYHSAWTEEDE